MISCQKEVLTGRLTLPQALLPFLFWTSCSLSHKVHIFFGAFAINVISYIKQGQSECMDSFTFCSVSFIFMHGFVCLSRHAYGRAAAGGYAVSNEQSNTCNNTLSVNYYVMRTLHSSCLSQIVVT